MYLSDNEIKHAIEQGDLIIDPLTGIDPTSIDLHLDSVTEARVWDIEKLKIDNSTRGWSDRELNIARMNYGEISRCYLISPPKESETSDSKVFVRENAVVLRPGGFLLWQTREIVGTPAENPKYICYVDGKSTRARTGLVVHLTAPTIHAGWHGNITLEIVNLGPLDMVLNEGDAVAQLIIARISSPPSRTHTAAGSSTIGQSSVTGAC